jgi:hypothetical protein
VGNSRYLTKTELLRRFQVAARETLGALESLDATWELNKERIPIPYGYGVSKWDGPCLLRMALEELARLEQR